MSARHGPPFWLLLLLVVLGATVLALAGALLFSFWLPAPQAKPNAVSPPLTTVLPAPAAAPAAGKPQELKQAWDDAAVLRLLYADYNLKAAAAELTDLRLPDQAEWQGIQWPRARVRVVSTYDYRLQGQTYRTALLQTSAFQSADACHGCGGLVGVAIFQRHGPQHWQLRRHAPYLTQAGVFGKIPLGRLIELGPMQRGLWFEDGYVSQGVQHSRGFLLGLDPAQPQVLLHLPDYARHTVETCPDETPSPTCWQVTARLDAEPGPQPDWLALIHHQRGHEPGPEGLQVVNRSQRYTFGAGKYRLATVAP
jgi:hypothetical protein